MSNCWGELNARKLRAILWILLAGCSARSSGVPFDFDSSAQDASTDVHDEQLRSSDGSTLDQTAPPPDAPADASVPADTTIDVNVEAAVDAIAPDVTVVDAFDAVAFDGPADVMAVDDASARDALTADVADGCTADHCGAPACTPGAALCDGAGARRVCAPDGLGYSLEACAEMPHAATSSCSGGRCVPLCDEAWGDCDGNPSNGCETALDSTAMSCGRCGTVCPSRPHAAGVCRSWVCVSQCDPSYADCDSDRTNGCEVNTGYDERNCGGCGRACPWGNSCVEGSCSVVLRPARMSLGRRNHATTAGLDGKLYVFGGFTSEGTTATCYSLDLRVDAGWNNVRPLPTPRAYISAVTAADGRIYVFGGTSATVHVYSPMTTFWTTAASMPSPRLSMAATRGADGAIYAFGGNTLAELSVTPTNIALRYDPTSDAWSTLPPLPTAVTRAAAVTLADGRILVIGGAIASGSTFAAVGLVQVFTPSTRTWSSGVPMPAPYERLGAAVGFDGRVYVAGGSSSMTSYSAFAYVFDPAMNGWSRMAFMPLGSRDHTFTAMPDRRLITIGGEMQGTAIDDRFVPYCFTYRIEADRWGI